MLLLRQIELLGSQDGAGAGDAYPANEGFGVNLEMFHRIKADQGTSASKTCLAVDGNGSCVWLGEVFLTRVHELLHDRVRRCASIREDHVLMVDSLLKEAVAIIFCFIEADYLGYVQVLEDVDVAGSCVPVPMNRVPLVYRPHKSQELAWDDPVQVTVFDLFVVFVLPGIECLKVVPAELDGLLESFQAMKDSAVVVAITTACISEVAQVRRVGLELSEGLVGVNLQNHDHKRAHQVGRVGDLGEVARLGVVVDPRRALEALTFQQLLQLAAESVRHCKIQRAEVFIERHVSEILHRPKNKTTSELVS